MLSCTEKDEINVHGTTVLFNLRKKIVKPVKKRIRVRVLPLYAPEPKITTGWKKLKLQKRIFVKIKKGTKK